jgi:hypothetical protein
MQRAERSLALWRNPLALLAAALVLAVYTVAILVIPEGAFWSPDEGAKFIQLESLGWRGGFAYEIPYAAKELDPGFELYPARCAPVPLYPVPLGADGAQFHWPMAFPLLSRVPLAVFGLRGLYVVPLLSGWLTALAAGQLMRAWSDRLSPAAILLVGLATPVCFFSLTYWEHTLTTFLALAALCAVARRSTVDARSLWLPALLLTASVLLRVEMLAFAGALLAAAWRLTDMPRARPQGRGRSWIAVSALAVLALLAAVPQRQLAYFTHLPEALRGNLAKLPHLHGALAAVFVDAPGNQAPIVGWLARRLAFVAFLAPIVSVFIRSAWIEGAVLLAALVGTFDFSLSLAIREPYLSLHGFLAVSPFLVFAVYALPPALRERQRSQLVIAGTGVLYAVLGFAAILTFKFGGDGSYATGLEWGNRGLLTLYPIATVLALAALQAYWRSTRPPLLKGAVSLTVAVLMLLGVLLEARGVWLLYESRQLAASWEVALRGPLPVVTDAWWLPADLAPFFTTHPMMCVKKPSALGSWLDGAQAHGVEGFTYASFHPVETDQLEPRNVVVTAEAQDVVSGLYIRRFHVARRRDADRP